MKHENYIGKIGDYINGIERNLTNVTANEGHDLVKVSILEQAKRLADTATHNNKFLVMMMDEFLTMLENQHAIANIGEYNVWERVSHKQLMKDFNTYLKWGLDAVDHFDDCKEEDLNIEEER